MLEVNKIYNMDCIEGMKLIPDGSIDCIITDPPYEIGFMGKGWDDTGIANNVDMWKECLRVLKPGGHLLSFAATRTYHRMASAIEDAGFEVRDMIEWVYGSGFPKSLNIGKAVDKLQRGNKTISLINALLEKGKTLKELGEMAGIPSLESSYRDWTTGGHKPEERSWERMLKGLGFSEADGLNIIEKRTVKLGGGNAYTFREGETRDWEMKRTKGTSKWEGWGTALKPAHEPICMARKPLAEKTVAENVLKYGTGGINIDESRIPTSDNRNREQKDGPLPSKYGFNSNTMGNRFVELSSLGRFPANLIHDNSEEVRECFPETKSVVRISEDKDEQQNTWSLGRTGITPRGHNDSGNASRFFKSIIYQAKASKSERNKGCEGLETSEKFTAGNYSQSPTCKDCEKTLNGTNDHSKCSGEVYYKEMESKNTKNNHPTVKPIALMEYLIKMVTKEGGTVLDPFVGSGTTLVAAKKNGYNYIGFELDNHYVDIANKRIQDKLSEK